MTTNPELILCAKCGLEIETEKTLEHIIYYHQDKEVANLVTLNRLSRRETKE